MGARRARIGPPRAKLSTPMFHVNHCARLGSPAHADRRPGGTAITYLSPLLAIVLGIMHAALAPVIVLGDVRPNLVLVGVVLVTAVAGFGPGITWAFVAGLTANLLVGEPLGSVPLAMLIVAAGVAGLGRVMGRWTWAHPVLAAAAGSMVADVVSLGVGQLVGGADVGTLPLGIMLRAAALNAGLVAVALYPARVAMARWAPDEIAAW